jgi:hypothetical protein
MPARLAQGKACAAGPTTHGAVDEWMTTVMLNVTPADFAQPSLKTRRPRGPIRADSASAMAAASPSTLFLVQLPVSNLALPAPAQTSIGRWVHGYLSGHYW